MELIITVKLTGDDAAVMAKDLPHLDNARLSAVNNGLRTRLGLYISDRSTPGDSTLTIVKRPGWVAGWNVPGYLPEDEPATFDTRDEAIAYLDDELERAMDDRAATADTEEQAEHIRSMYGLVLSCLRSNAPQCLDAYHVSCGKYVWWIVPERVS